MGGAAARRVAVLAGFTLAATLAGCGSVASDREGSSPEPTGPTHPVPTAEPSAPSSPVTSTVGGWSIRYLEHGEIKVLEVEDFPR